MTPFAILGAPKTSTSTIVALCNAHPRVLALFEIDFTQGPDFNRNAEFTARYPEARKLFAASLPLGDALGEVAAILRAQGGMHSISSAPRFRSSMPTACATLR